MKRILMIAIILNVTFGFAQSEFYSTAIGIRAGETSGLTIKQFLGGSSTALEGIVGIWSHGLSATLLFEKYAPAGVSGLNWYYGAGGHVAFETVRNNWYYRNDRYYEYRHDHVGIGIDGVVGIEYKIKPIPIALSFDIKPFIELNNHGGALIALDPGLGVKLAF